jgi:hypothetical protein
MASAHIFLVVRLSVQFVLSPCLLLCSVLDFFELSHRLGSRAGEFWSHFFIHQRKINNSMHLLKWFAGELPEVNHQLVHMDTFFIVSQDCPCINGGTRSG